MNLRALCSCLLICFSILSSAEGQIKVYTNAQQGDTAGIAIREFFDFLSKAGQGNYTVAPLSSWDNKGFAFVLTSEARRNKINIPNKLSQYGAEGLYIKADDKSVLMVGNTALAIQQATFIYLEKLGFRFLVPGELWINIPRLKSVYKKCDILTQPDYDNRTIANGHGYMNSTKILNDFVNWERANRMGGSFPVRNGHSYDEIVLNNAAIFKEHPEYFAEPVPKGTLPAAPKFNVANKELVRLVAQDAVNRLDIYKKIGEHTKMVSMEPSDGGGFCKSPACLAIGGPSDQAFYLTNAAAREIRKKYPDTWVGSYAYNEHIIPTKLKLEPNVFVMITNGFNRSRYSTEELLAMWLKKTPKTGVYEYLNVYEGSMDMPGQMHIQNTKYLAKSIRSFYNAGATTYVGESTMGWISKAVGNYVLAHLLWDRNSDVEEIKNDFYVNAFGDVAPLMRKMMDSWEEYPYRVPADNDIADWLSLTNEAYFKSNDSLIKKRIHNVKIYLHYIVLFRNLKKNKTEENFIRATTFAYRTFETAAFATLPALVSLGNYSGFNGYGWYEKEDQPWKRDKRPVTDQELEQLFQDDLRLIKRVEGIVLYKPVNQFVKLYSVIKPPNKTFEESNISTWGPTEYIIQITEKSLKNTFTIQSGAAANPAVDRDVSISVYHLNDIEKLSPIYKVFQHKKNTEETFSLGTLQPGFYRMRVDDQNKLFILKYSPGINFSIAIRPQEILLTTTVLGYNVFYFYVPKGIKRFQISKTVTLKVESPKGRIIDKEGGSEETFVVDVQNGEEGLWKIFKQSGNLHIDGVPPYLGTHPSKMLIPADIKK